MTRMQAQDATADRTPEEIFHNEIENTLPIASNLSHVPGHSLTRPTLLSARPG
jgi:hypothetical protein